MNYAKWIAHFMRNRENRPEPAGSEMRTNRGMRVSDRRRVQPRSD